MTQPSETNQTGIFLHDVYLAEFRRHAITMIWMAFGRLAAEDLVTGDEDDITGELVREVRVVLQDSLAPDWVDHYEVREQVPQNTVEKRGNRRPKMDIELERHQRGMRPCLGFEAKRLGRGRSLGGYLGSEGLGAFLSSYYPTTHGEAGMLGYVQERSADMWSTKLATELSRKACKHRVVRGCGLKRCDSDADMPAFYSGHTDVEGRSLLVVHILLPFAG